MRAVLPAVRSLLSSIGIILLYIFVSMVSGAVFAGHMFLPSLIADAVTLAFCVFVMKRLRDKHTDPHLYTSAGDFSVSRVSVAFVFWLISIYMLITVALYISKLFTDPEMDSRQEYFEGRQAVSPFLQFFFSCIAAPVTEEFIFRHCVYNLMKDKCHWIVAMFMSGLLFGAMHGTITHIVFGTFFGCILVLIYENTGRHIVITMICHSLYNITATNTLETSYPSSAATFWLYVVLMACLITAACVKTDHEFRDRIAALSDDPK